MKILVVGAGSWGTALAVHCAKYHQQVFLWGRHVDQLRSPVGASKKSNCISDYSFPSHLTVEPDIKKACKDVTYVIIAVPSVAFREVLQLLKASGINAAIFISATKGLEVNTGHFLSQVFKEIFPEESRFMVLAGPSFAKEVIAGLPTAAILSSADKQVGQAGQVLLHHNNFRVYTNTDMVGTQLGACLKNVLAIAVAISDGLGYGANSRAALITRGLAEMQKLAEVMGAQSQTIYGLAGLGDLVLTATDNQSRNRRFGLYLGQGMSIEDAQNKVKQVVEGVNSVHAVMHLIKRYHLELPITQQVFDIVYHGLSPQEAVKNLINRSPTEEKGNDI